MSPTTALAAMTGTSLPRNTTGDGPQIKHISTENCTIRITTVGSGSPAILLLHGNSFNSTIFRHILASPLADNFTLIALDLPGHGGSSNAAPCTANEVYTMSSYADVALTVLRQLHIKEVIIIGWSLGGHIAIEMVGKTPVAPSDTSEINILGAMLIGSPPVNTGEVPLAFTLATNDPSTGWRTSYPARDDLSDAEIREYARVCADAPYEDWMYAAVKRTDSAARRIMFEAFAGTAAEITQRDVVENRSDVLWAVVNGKEEPWIRLDFVRDVRWANLWKGECVEMDGLLHAPFWGNPDAFQPVLEEFVGDCQAEGESDFDSI